MPFLTKDEIYLFHQGTYRQGWTTFGCHPEGEGWRFTVWAPWARSVSVAGTFNGWNETAAPLEPVDDTGGIWTGVVSGPKEGDLYKYVIVSPAGEKLYRADPYARFAELRPGTASAVLGESDYAWGDADWLAARASRDHRRSPLNIYELHPGTWRRRPDGSFLTWRELADQLAPYAAEMGYTHVELLPVSEHPFDGSWGYQVTGYFAPSSRFGDPDGLRYLVDRLHREGIGVILDWVPGHFCKDEFGLGRFNGEKLYELFDHKQWGTYVFDYGRPEVRSFLLSNAIYWVREFHADGIRFDGVSSMLYLNYGVEDPREKRFNKNGGEENLEAMSLLQEVNAAVAEESAGVFTVAEESTAWPLVTYPPETGGLGFHYKWNMGWMNDTLRYMQEQFLWRKDHHDLLTFSMMYAFSENYILPLSHDEVVHGKRSLIGRMPGDYGQQFAGLRLLMLYQMTMPGGKLLFMGGEFGQFIEWRDYEQLQWFLPEQYDAHRRHREFVRELNKLYRREKALWGDDHGWDGFRWLDANDAAQSILSYERRYHGETVTVVLNFGDRGYGDFRIGVEEPGRYRAILHSNVIPESRATVWEARPEPMHGRENSIAIELPPLSGILIKKV